MGHREQGWVNIMKPRGQTEEGIRGKLRISYLGLRMEISLVSPAVSFSTWLGLLTKMLW